MLSHSAPHCATLSLDVPCCPRASLAVPTLSVNVPLSSCCSPAVPPTPRPAGLPVRAGLLPCEAPLALARESSATPAAAANRGPGNTRQTPPGPGNDGKPRATLGAPFGLGGTRAETELPSHFGEKFSLRILTAQQPLLGSGRAEARRPPRPRNGSLGHKGCITAGPRDAGGPQASAWAAASPL